LAREVTDGKPASLRRPTRVSGILIECGQAKFSAQGVGVIWSKRLAEDAGCSFAVGADLLVIAKVVQDYSEDYQDSSDIGVVRSIAGFGDGQRSFEVGPCCAVIAEVVQGVAEVSQYPGRLGMIWPVGRFRDRQGRRK
jgi:hypothetical protein